MGQQLLPLNKPKQPFDASQQAAIAAAASGFQPATPTGPGAQPTGGFSSGSGAARQRQQQEQHQQQQQIVLIQGPPGTGKTSAIMGMLSAFLASNAAAPSSAGSSNSSGGARGGVGQQQQQQRGGGGGSGSSGSKPAGAPPRVRVLLCAQSNAAVDELCSRVAKGVMSRWVGG